MKTYFQNLIHIYNDTYGKRVILDFAYNQYSLKTHAIFARNMNILKRIALMMNNRTNEKLKRVIDGIRFIKNYKKCFVNKDKAKQIFTYIVFQEYRFNQIDTFKELNYNKNEDTDTLMNMNLYSKIFGTSKMSKFEKKIRAVYKQNYNYKYISVSFFFYFIDIYNPLTSRHCNFILSSKDLSITLKKIKNKNIQEKYIVSSDELILLIPKKITIKEDFGGKKVLLNFTKYKHLRMDWKEQMEYKNRMLLNRKRQERQQLELKIYLKASFINVAYRDSVYEITTDEEQLILKTVKVYTLKEKKYTSIIAIYYHKILEYWTLIIFFPHNSRKFITVLEPKEVVKIVQSQNFMDMNVIDDNSISEREIWKYVIANSKLLTNIEGNEYFEVFTTKILLKEFLYNGFEIISDGYNDELNRVIYIEITVKSNNLFLLGPIENIINKVEVETTHIIFQSFSFHDLSWHKENFRLDDFEDAFKTKIIQNQNVVKLREISREEEVLQKNEDHTMKFAPKIIETTKIEIRKFFPFSLLRRLPVPIIKPYVNSQQHVFEAQMKSIENKGLNEGSLSRLIESIKYDRAHRKAISSIYKQKLENQILFQKIYSEYISYNPPILASIGLSLVKEHAIISLYYPYQTNSLDLTIDFNKIKELFFPYFNDILIIDKHELGKRIMRKYQNFIKTSPGFIKLFRK